MPITKATPCKARHSITVLRYVCNREKTMDEQGNRTIEGFGGCCWQTANQDFQSNKEHWNKTQGRQCMHYIVSFPVEQVSRQQGMDLVREMVQKSPQFQGFQGIIACHGDHYHIVVDSVNVEDGHKFQMSQSQYYKFMQNNQEICREHNLETIAIEHGRTGRNWTINDPAQYHAIEEAQSLFDQGKTDEACRRSSLWYCQWQIENAKEVARDREEFIKEMEIRGYDVQWNDSKNNSITYRANENNKYYEPATAHNHRSRNLCEAGKEELANAFEKARTREREPERTIRSTDRTHEPAERYSAEYREFEQQLSDARDSFNAGRAEYTTSSERIRGHFEKFRLHQSEGRAEFTETLCRYVRNYAADSRKFERNDREREERELRIADRNQEIDELVERNNAISDELNDRTRTMHREISL